MDEKQINSLIPTEFLSYRIVQLTQRLTAQAGYILENGAGLTVSQWRIIAMLGSGGANTSRGLLKHITVDAALISRQLKTLEKDGLVQTERAEDDRRVLRCTLTENGLALYEKMLPVMKERQQRLYASLTQEEITALSSVINKLDTAADKRDFDI